ncbi:MAG: hypothetical protein HVN35_10405 [Methanobacteriaceae archaeon]|nr:hypothetical protein [Methanobacteriaceae archaeon]
MDDADEIWKFFVRCNIDSLGIKSKIVGDHWEIIPENSMLKQLERLLKGLKGLKGLNCYKNFSNECPVTFKSGTFENKENCCNIAQFDECPVVILIKEIKWHRAHYKIAKIIAETAKRLLIQDPYGKKEGNLNDVVNAAIKKHENTSDQWQHQATKYLLKKFEDIKWYGNPPKAVVWFFSELSSPVHQVEHWEFDLWEFTPVDTHVQRLSNRFGFLSKNSDIKTALSELFLKNHENLILPYIGWVGKRKEIYAGKTLIVVFAKNNYLLFLRRVLVMLRSQ